MATEAQIPRVKQKRPPTMRQKLALDEIVANGGNVSKAMLKVGYSPATAQTPQKLTESDGFRALASRLGLTETLLTKALVEDIKAKKKNRKAELELGYKVLGRLRDRDDDRSNIINLNFFNGDQLRKIAERYARSEVVPELQQTVQEESSHNV